MITQKELKEILDYNELTGDFTWKKSISDKTKLNSVAGSKKYWKQRPLRIVIRINKKDYQAHRLAWFYVNGQFPELHIDHIDGNPFNNSINNLRQCTPALNNQNRHESQTNSTTKILGVTWHKKAKKWASYLSLNRKTHYLGLFETTDEAHAAYLKAKRDLHEFCTI